MLWNLAQCTWVYSVLWNDWTPYPGPRSIPGFRIWDDKIA